MSMLYPGLHPSNVNKDAKYSVVSGPGGYRVRLTYTVAEGERELLTTDRHEALVDMVNEVKREHQGQLGGVFYINEFKDVLVPIHGDGCFYAGTYEPRLEFEFNGGTLGPDAPEGLVAGQPWPGPHVGIKYVLKAGGNDVKYTIRVSPTREQTVQLSDTVGHDAAAHLARRLAKNKGDGGGRIYINEANEFFAPVASGSRVAYTYLGSLGEDLWFDPPEVPGRD